jgi:hypothetical protein
MKTIEKVYQALAIDDEGRLCKDIPESACHQQPNHFFTHISSLTLSKLADSFVDPKLILSWLLANLGSSSATIGFLVPIREAGALLPQLFFSEWIRTRRKRKWVWAGGAIVQGLAVLAMVLCVVTLSNQQAAIGVLICLTLLAIARSFCSVSYKDVLGKTLSKSTRGTATGTASSIAASGIICFALALGFNLVELNTNSILMLLGAAGVLWIISAVNFMQLKEESAITKGGKNGAKNIYAQIKQTFQERQFTLFVLVRGVLTVTALAPPFLILLAQQNSQQPNHFASPSFSLSGDVSQFGGLLFASALASLTSSYFWGRLADRSSRRVLIFSAVLASCSLLATFLLELILPSALALWFTLPLILFVLMVAYQGVRLGRSTHLVDMANEDTRASYTAVSNSAIGILLLFGSAFGWLADQIGVNWVLLIFALMCAAAILMAVRLKEVQIKEEQTNDVQINYDR